MGVTPLQLSCSLVIFAPRGASSCFVALSFCWTALPAHLCSPHAPPSLCSNVTSWKSPHGGPDHPPVGSSSPCFILFFVASITALYCSPLLSDSLPASRNQDLLSTTASPRMEQLAHSKHFMKAPPNSSSNVNQIDTQLGRETAVVLQQASEQAFLSGASPVPADNLLGTEKSTSP